MNTVEVVFHGPRTVSTRVDRSRLVQVAPKLVGVEYPKRGIDEELFSIVTLGLFKPWRDVRVLCGDGGNARDLLDNFMLTCTEATREMVENLPT